METRGSSRIWLIGGVAAIVVLVIATYLLAIKPVYDEKALTQTQTEDQAAELIKVKHQIADLKAQSLKMATYTAELTAKRTQLPDNYDIPNYLRQLQKTDTAISIDNNSVSVSSPVKVPGSATVVGVPISLVAQGDPAELSKFVSRVQNIQNRAALVSGAILTVNKTDVKKSMMTLSVTAFCSKKDESDCKVTNATS